MSDIVGRVTQALYAKLQTLLARDGYLGAYQVNDVTDADYEPTGAKSTTIDGPVDLEALTQAAIAELRAGDARIDVAFIEAGI